MKVQLQSDPTNENVRGILSESQGRLAELFQILVERHNHRSMAKWLKYGDTCSKLLFDFHHISNKRILLNELEVDGETFFKQEDLSHYISQFYTKLYTFEPPSHGIAEAQKKCWESVPYRFTEDMNAEMT